MKSIKAKSNVIIKVVMLILLSFVIVQGWFGILTQAAGKVKVGKTFKDEGIIYKITDLSPKEVEVVGIYGSKWYSSQSPLLKKQLFVGGVVEYLNNNYKITSIAQNSFKGKKKIKVAWIGDTIKNIGDGAFKGCSGLVEVHIGKNVRVIGKEAFFNCKKLDSICIDSKKLKKIGDKAFKKISKTGRVECK